MSATTGAPAWAAEISDWTAVGAVEERTCSRTFGIYQVQVVQVRDEAGNVTTTAVEVASDLAVWTGPLGELASDFVQAAQEAVAVAELLRDLATGGRS